MYERFYIRGQLDVYTQLGMDKEAAMPRLLTRAGKFLKSKLPSQQAVKKFFMGNPRRAAHEWRMKESLKPGSVFREGFEAPGMLNKALLYGFPAVEAANIARGEKGERAERIGGLLGGTALGLAAWGPTGLLGSMAAGAVGERIGRGLGRTGKYVGRVTPRAEELPDRNLTLGYNGEPPYTWR
jgi:hypothetical protein